MSRRVNGRRFLVLALLVLLLLATGTVVAVLVRRDDHPAATPGPRVSAPALGSVKLGHLADSERPASPRQWQADAGGIPSNQWWSSAVVGPGTHTLWTTPLGVRVTDAGEVLFAEESPQIVDNETTRTPFVPTAFLLAPPGGGATTAVVGWGALHVVLRLADRSGVGHIDLTLTRGNVVAELAVTGRPASFLIPGLKIESQDDRAATLTSSRGRWVLASDVAVSWQVAGDVLTVASGDREPFRLALGPEPTGATGWPDVVRSVAANPLLSTEERVEGPDHGLVRQHLIVRRTHDAPTPLALLAHHVAGLVEQGESVAPALGTVAGGATGHPVRLASELTIGYRLPGLLWSTVSPTDATDVSSIEVTPVEVSPVESGSYFGGKAAYRSALLADLVSAGDQKGVAAVARGQVRAMFDRLIAGVGPTVTWDESWGSLILSPAEFGAGSELNDHHLQGGYWVAAASFLAEDDRTWSHTIGPFVDALIADYAGTDVVPILRATGLPPMRTWSPYDGHSWASGIVPFDDGNNLESISEAIFSSWAAARWFVVTGRPEFAKPFVARLAIEQTLSDGQWLPTSLSGDGSARPWSGVVWAAKVDAATWFSPLAEAALGIRLLPLGPQSLARYATSDASAAARRRWAWCDRAGGGCDDLWPNLLASDAIAAGHPPPVGSGTASEAESSTSAAVVAWWTGVFQALPGTAEEATCSPGATARRRADGVMVVLASNPSDRPVSLSCVTVSGERLWQRVLKPGERRADPVVASAGHDR